jgi:hypothetical protein
VNQWSQADIDSEIDISEIELEEKRRTLSSLEWARKQLEERAATYRNVRVPPSLNKSLQKKENQIKILKVEIERLEEATSIRSLIALGRRFYEEGLVSTVEDLQGQIEQAERLLLKGYEELKPALASFQFQLAKLTEKGGKGNYAVRLLERSKELYLQIGDESKIAAIQSELINLLIRQGDNYYYSQADDRDNSLELAWRKYLHARDEIAHFRGFGQINQEINILGSLVRVYEEQGDFAQALDCRLDRLDCFIKQEAKRKIYPEIKSIRSLCRRLDDREAAQNWFKAAYFQVKGFFFLSEDVDGLEILKGLAADFEFHKLESEIETVIQDVQQKQQEYRSKLNLFERQPRDSVVVPSVSKSAGELHQLLVSSFNEEELRTLCLYLGVDYDILSGEGKEGKARELVLYLDRRDQLFELTETGQRMRPDITWGDVPEAVDQELVIEDRICRDDHLRNLIRIHERNLMILEEKIARYTEMDAPVGVLNQRDYEQEKIERLKAELRDLEAG